MGEVAARMLKPMVLQLDGSDPFIVLPDADLAATAKVAAAARTINAGQSCIADKRFIGHASIYDRFVPLFAEAVSAFRMGDPFNRTTDIGPQARFDSRDALHRQERLLSRRGRDR